MLGWNHQTLPLHISYMGTVWEILILYLTYAFSDRQGRIQISRGGQSNIQVQWVKILKRRNAIWECWGRGVMATPSAPPGSATYHIKLVKKYTFQGSNFHIQDTHPVVSLYISLHGSVYRRILNSNYYGPCRWYTTRITITIIGIIRTWLVGLNYSHGLLVTYSGCLSYGCQQR